MSHEKPNEPRLLDVLDHHHEALARELAACGGNGQSLETVLGAMERARASLPEEEQAVLNHWATTDGRESADEAERFLSEQQPEPGDPT